MINVPTDLLRTFIAVTDLRSFTRAAQALGVTQPAVSAQIKRLQMLLGAELFDKSAPGVTLTAQGRGDRQLRAAHARAQRPDARRRRRTAARWRGCASGSRSTTSKGRSCARSPAFRGAHPDLRLQISCRAFLRAAARPAPRRLRSRGRGIRHRAGRRARTGAGSSRSAWGAASAAVAEARRAGAARSWSARAACRAASACRRSSAPGRTTRSSMWRELRRPGPGGGGRARRRLLGAALPARGGTAGARRRAAAARRLPDVYRRRCYLREGLDRPDVERARRPDRGGGRRGATRDARLPRSRAAPVRPARICLALRETGALRPAGHARFQHRHQGVHHDALDREREQAGEDQRHLKLRLRLQHQIADADIRRHALGNHRADEGERDRDLQRAEEIRQRARDSRPCA